MNSIRRSTDGGTKWTTDTSILPDGNIWMFVFHPANSKIIWAGGQGRIGTWGLWKKTDGAASWKPIGKGLPASNAVGGLLVDPTKPDTLYTFTNNVVENGGFTSVDGGETWVRFGGTFPQKAKVETVTMHPSAHQTLYAF